MFEEIRWQRFYFIILSSLPVDRPTFRKSFIGNWPTSGHDAPASSSSAPKRLQSLLQAITRGF
jgi:hypothetical protein